MIPILPEWAPNLHPLIIHFPIALLATAVVFDLVSLFTRKWAGVRIAAVILFAFGAFGAYASFLTGRNAADALDLPASAVANVTDHADWAEVTVWFFLIYAVVRLFVLWFDIKGRRWAQLRVHVLLFIMGAGGYYLVVQTADRGARLVYAHGLGVKPVMEQAAAGPAVIEPPATPGKTTGIKVEANGSWQWGAGIGSRQAFGEDFHFVQGRLSDLRMETTEKDSALVLRLESGPVLITAGDPIASVQAEAMLNIERFEGTVRLVHHLQDSLNYDFLEIADGQLRQGRLQDGKPTIFAEQALQPTSWSAVRAVSDGTHFRGYATGEMLTHGHGDAPDAGPVGLYLKGSGTVLLRRLTATSLR